MTWSPAQRGDRVIAALWAASSAGVLLASNYAGAIAAWLPACPFRRWTGLPCLTCGGTRAVLALCRGDLLGALAFNPLVTGSAITFVAGGLIAPIWIALGRRVPTMTSLSLRARGLLLMAIVASWVVVLLYHLGEKAAAAPSIYSSAYNFPSLLPT